MNKYILRIDGSVNAVHEDTQNISDVIEMFRQMIGTGKVSRLRTVDGMRHFVLINWNSVQTVEFFEHHDDGIGAFDWDSFKFGLTRSRCHQE